MTAPAARRPDLSTAKLTLAQQARAWADAMETMPDTSTAAQQMHERACAIAEGAGEVADELTERGR